MNLRLFSSGEKNRPGVFERRTLPGTMQILLIMEWDFKKKTLLSVSQELLQFQKSDQMYSCHGL